MRSRTLPVRRKQQLARPRLGIRDDLGQRRRRHIAVDRNSKRRARQHADRRVVLGHPVALKQHRAQQLCGGRKPQGVTIRRGLGNQVSADHAGGAGARIDYDLLAQCLGEFGREVACYCFGAGAGGGGGY